MPDQELVTDREEITREVNRIFASFYQDTTDCTSPSCREQGHVLRLRVQEVLEKTMR